MSSTSTSRNPSLARLETRLDYHFQNRALLEQSLTHKSHSKKHYERLEFLGDAVLGYVVAEILYRRHSDLAEDALTLLRAQLVRRDTLSGIATELGLGEFLRLGTGERRSGGRTRASILADALEAVIGAVVLDGGIEAGRALIARLYADRLEAAGAQTVSKDAKTTLQELLQARALALPRYEVVATTGSEHEQTFTVSCRVDELSLQTTGRGTSRRAAEKAAARMMIERMDDQDST